VFSYREKIPTERGKEMTKQRAGHDYPELTEDNFSTEDGQVARLVRDISELSSDLGGALEDGQFDQASNILLQMEKQLNAIHMKVKRQEYYLANPR
jgi:hypothetical protein